MSRHARTVWNNRLIVGWTVLLLLAGAPLQAQDPSPDPIAAPAITDDALVSMVLRDTDIREALRLLARQSGANIVLSDKVQGKVTLELTGATVTQALDAIVETNGYVHELRGNLILVSTLDEIVNRKTKLKEYNGVQINEADQTAVRVFVLQHADARRISALVRPMLTSLGKLEVMPSGDETYSPDNKTGSEYAQIGNNITHSSEGKPARSDTMVVVDNPKRLEVISEEVQKLDVKPKQVLIEARFVEITLGDDRQLGIDWNAVIQASGAAAPHTFPFGGTKLGSFNPRNVAATGNVNGVFPPAPGSVSTPGTAGLFTFGALDFSAFTAVLKMIEESSKIEQVSNPSVRVNDNTTATILVGERFPIFSAVTTDNGTTTEEVERYEPVGVQLVVTPSILQDGRISMIIRPGISSLGPSVVGSTGIQAPRFITREVDTTVMARNGHTIVLGGLVSERKTKVVSKVPFLSSIPLLGELFTHESTNTEKIELAIFLTPIIVDDTTLAERHRRLFESTDPEGNPKPVGQLDRSPLDFASAKAEY